MRPIHPNLIARGRRPDPSWRQIIEAHVLETNTNGTPREHIRLTKDDWAEADGGAAAVDADFIRKDNGDLVLKGTLSTLLTNTPGAITYLTDLQLATQWDAIMLEVPSPVSIADIQVYLNPRRSGAARREVVLWRLRLFGCTDLRGLGGDPSGTFLGLAELADPIDVAVTGDAAGFVTFVYPTHPNTGALTRTMREDSSGIIPGIFQLHGFVLIVLGALNETGGLATNVGLGYNAGAAEVVSGSYKVRGRRFIQQTEGYAAGLWRDEGSSGGAPYVTIEAGSYTAKTITFATNAFNVGATPAGDLELTGHTATPPGTAVTLEVRNDADAAYVAFADGQLHSDIGIGKTQPRKMRATLTPNAAGNLSPTLKRLGLRAVTRKDFSRICEVRSCEWAFDPQALKTEIPDGRLIALKDGPQDFRSAIEELLVKNYPKNIVLRSYIGDTALPRAQWLHKTDFLLGDWEGKAGHIALQGLSPLVKLKDLVPPYSPGINYPPDGTQSIGSWTDLAGGTTNVHLGIDEPVADETDGIRSGLNPSNQEIVFTLPTPTDTAGRRFFVDCDYLKDAAGGQTLEMKIRVYQGATLKAELVKAAVGPDRVKSTMELTEVQIASITDPADLRLAFVANATGGAGDRRIVVTWARFRTGGRREVVTYVNQTPKAIYDDLVDNRLALQARWRGPGIEETGYTLSKQLTGLRERQQTGKDLVGKDEIQFLNYIAGNILLESQGRIVSRSVFGAQPIRAVFPSREIIVPSAGPGLAGRVPEFYFGYGWDAANAEFKNETHAFHQPSLDAFERDTLGPPKWEDEEVGKWVDTDAVADRLALRRVQTFGCGEMLWPFSSTYCHPELEIGDLVAIETDKFVGRDPNVPREIRGRRWVLGLIQRVDFWGQHFTLLPRGYADILGQTESASRFGFAEEISRQLVIGFARFAPETSGDLWSFAGLSYARPAVTLGADHDAVAHLTPAELPHGATITKFAAHWYGDDLSAGSSQFLSTLWRVKHDGTGREGMAQIALSDNTGTWLTTEVAVNNPVVDWNTYHYYIWNALRAAGTFDNNRFMWNRVDYTALRAEPSREPLPASPAVVSLTTSAFGVDATSHLVAMPATTVAGELLLIHFTNKTSNVPSTPGGWTLLFSMANAALQIRTSVYVKVADGTEGGTTVDVVTSGTRKAAAHVYEITSWYGDLTGVEEAHGQGNSTTPDPPSLSPSWASKLALWLALFGEDNQGAASVYPTNYTDGTFTASGGANGVAVGSARRLLEASTENPGTFTVAAGQPWIAATVAIRPPA